MAHLNGGIESISSAISSRICDRKRQLDHLFSNLLYAAETRLDIRSEEVGVHMPGPSSLLGLLS